MDRLNGRERRPVVSPVTGETLAEAPDASAEDVGQSVAAALAAQRYTMLDMSELKTVVLGVGGLD